MCECQLHEFLYLVESSSGDEDDDDDDDDAAMAAGLNHDTMGSNTNRSVTLGLSDTSSNNSIPVTAPSAAVLTSTPAASAPQPAVAPAPVDIPPVLPSRVTSQPPPPNRPLPSSPNHRLVTSLVDHSHRNMVCI